MSGLAEMVATGDRRRSLVALRDHLAVRLEDASSREVAPIARQLAEVIRELDSLPDEKEGSVVDDLASRRSSRRAASQGQ